MEPGSTVSGRLPRIGEVLLGKYTLQRELGAGGMGIVFAAHHVELDRTVAVKVLHAGFANSDVALRFLREARTVVKIESEHVAQVIDVGRIDDHTPFIVMEYLEGEDLNHLLEHVQPSVGDAVDYVVQACVAMVEAHQLGIVHRDLKPANLFLTHRRDGSPIVKVLDFGISKWNEPEASFAGLTNPAAFLGSPQYMSPEQLRSASTVDHRTDIWSLGMILFELLAGRPAFERESLALLMSAILNDPAPDVASIRPEVPPELSAVIQQCLVKDREHRFQNVGELAQALVPFAPHRSHWNIERISKASGLGSVMISSWPAARVPSVPPSVPSVQSGLGAQSGPSAHSGPRVQSGARIQSGLTAQSVPPLPSAPPPAVTASAWVGEQGSSAGRRATQRKVFLSVGLAGVLAVATGVGLWRLFGAPQATEAGLGGAAKDTAQGSQSGPSTLAGANTLSPASATAAERPSVFPAAGSEPVAASSALPAAEATPSATSSAGAGTPNDGANKPNAPAIGRPPQRPAAPPVNPSPGERKPDPTRPGNPLQMDLK
jgi:eukaryotic-like serine/threonine-protein kinase